MGFFPTVLLNHDPCAAGPVMRSPVPVAGICFLPLRAAVPGVLTTTLLIVVVAMLPPGAGRPTPALAPPLAGDCGAGAADLTGVRGTGLPFGACIANHTRTHVHSPSSVHLHAAACHPCSGNHTPANPRGRTPQMPAMPIPHSR